MDFRTVNKSKGNFLIFSLDDPLTGTKHVHLGGSLLDSKDLTKVESIQKKFRKLPVIVIAEPTIAINPKHQVLEICRILFVLELSDIKV